MDKKGVAMRRITVFGFLIIFGIIVIASGCETAKGLTKGFGYTVADTGRGMVKDASNFWQAIFKADEWIKKNLW